MFQTIRKECRSAIISIMFWDKNLFRKGKQAIWEIKGIEVQFAILAIF